MLRARRAWLIVAAIGLGAASVRAADDVDFERHIVPLLARSCAGCHNTSDPHGALDLTRRDSALAGGESHQPALVPGDPDSSNLLERARSGEMPPEGKGPRLSPAELGQLETWIRAGAPWPATRVLSPFEFTTALRAGRDWWSLQRPRRPGVPAMRHGDRVRTPIDAFIIDELERRGLELADDADRAMFIRRAHLDLLGLPPSREAIDAFVQDTAPDAYERLIDRLLASPHYGERWARHWLDVVRFGESDGYETNKARANAWPYRDWVIGALNEDLPYPQFIRAQLAGDQFNLDAATGYLVGGAHDVVGSPDVELTLQQRMNDLDDMVSTTATAFLGLTVGCAKCHDHKFDPIAQRDYYALQAIFSGVRHGDRELRTPDAPQRQKKETELRNELALAEREVQAITTRYQPLARLTTVSADQQRVAVTASMNVDRFVPVRARFVRFTALSTDPAARGAGTIEPCLDELEVFTAEERPRNVALASSGARPSASSVYANGTFSLHKLEHVNDGQYGNARSWISGEAGTGWVQIELGEPATIDCVVWARDRDGAYQDRLATRYKIETSQTGSDWQLAASGEDRKPFDPQAKPSERPSIEGLPADAVARIDHCRDEIQRLKARIEQLAPRQIYAGTFATPEPTHLLYRGEPLQKRELVAPGAIAAIDLPYGAAAESAEAERRAALARWLGSEANPLTARVMVNRIWQYHFGQGLVKTSSDFGFNGGVPSHPTLLDWLAMEFMARGWSAKAIHRQIMLSSVYRQASRPSARAMAQDAGDRLLWRFAPRRLEAEAIRDAVLWASGALDTRMGGPGYDAFEPNTSYVKIYTPRQAFGPAEWRRMVYQAKPRMRQDATFGDFDCPDSSQTMARRNSSTTALQALNLLNGSFMMQQAGVFAQRLEREAGPDADERIRLAFWLAFGRAPDVQELAAAQQLVRGEGLSVFCRALYNANEFLYLN